jgi:hypothetical protein
MDSPRKADFEQLIARLAAELRARNLTFMLIGGQAVLVHGEPRLTQDIDVTLGAAPSRLDDVLDACRSLGLEPLPSDVAAFVRSSFVLPAADPATHIRVDFVFSTTPYEAYAIARAVTVDVAGEGVPFASAEDLIIHKIFAGRARDLEDAAGVVRRKGGALDWPYLRRWAAEFALIPGRESMPEQIDQLARILSPP